MTKLSRVLGGLLLLLAPVCVAQSPTTQSQIDCNWLTVDTMAKTATFYLTAGLTQLNGGLNFNGFNDGKLTLTVPTTWTVDRKSTRLNSSHVRISYAVFCLKKKKTNQNNSNTLRNDKKKQ